jgi:hypothetical protein
MYWIGERNELFERGPVRREEGGVRLACDVGHGHDIELTGAVCVRRGQYERVRRIRRERLPCSVAKIDGPSRDLDRARHDIRLDGAVERVEPPGGQLS